MNNAKSVKGEISYCIQYDLPLSTSNCRETLELIQGYEDEIKRLKHLVDKAFEGSGREKEKTPLEQVDAAMIKYREVTGLDPTVIIANVPAWDKMVKEAEKRMNQNPTNYATFRGIRVYKTDDGLQTPCIRLARGIKTYDIEGGE